MTWQIGRRGNMGRARPKARGEGRGVRTRQARAKGFSNFRQLGSHGGAGPTRHGRPWLAATRGGPAGGARPFALGHFGSIDGESAN